MHKITVWITGALGAINHDTESMLVLSTITRATDVEESYTESRETKKFQTRVADES